MFVLWLHIPGYLLTIHLLEIQLLLHFNKNAIVMWAFLLKWSFVFTVCCVCVLYSAPTDCIDWNISL